jgi:hypothetical protein
MSMSVGASSSSTLSYLQSLMQQGSAKDAKKTAASDPLSMLMQAISDDGAATAQAATAQPAAKPGAGAGATCASFSPDAMSALIAAQGQQPTADSPAAKLFAKLDTDGDGKISKTEFSDAASKAGADSSIADAVYAKIDGDSDGTISKAELSKADHGGHHHHHAGKAGGGGDPLEALMSGTGVNGATTQTATNADGSTTTTISYADGSKIDMTSAVKTAQSVGNAVDKSANNLLEQLIKLQSQVVKLAVPAMLAVA